MVFCWTYFSSLKMKDICPSPVDFHRTTLRYISEGKVESFITTAVRTLNLTKLFFPSQEVYYFNYINASIILIIDGSSCFQDLASHTADSQVSLVGQVSSLGRGPPVEKQYLLENTTELRVTAQYEEVSSLYISFVHTGV
jgi:hypothetical protein